jgi:hypothetical protein
MLYGLALNGLISGWCVTKAAAALSLKGVYICWKLELVALQVIAHVVEDYFLWQHSF